MKKIMVVGMMLGAFGVSGVVSAADISLDAAGSGNLVAASANEPSSRLQSENLNSSSPCGYCVFMVEDVEELNSDNGNQQLTVTSVPMVEWTEEGIDEFVAKKTPFKGTLQLKNGKKVDVTVNKVTRKPFKRVEMVVRIPGERVASESGEIAGSSGGDSLPAVITFYKK